MTYSHSAPLSMMHADQELIIDEIQGNIQFINRLKEMGLHQGVKIILLATGHPGPLIVKLQGTKIALGHGMAHKIMVKNNE